jgi:outer membrane lipase/esterase
LPRRLTPTADFGVLTLPLPVFSALRAPLANPKLSNSARLVASVLGASALLLALASCGGGTSQYEPFVPLRMVSFGDEMSALTADGHHWGVNGFADTNNTPDDTTDDVFNCRVLPNWTVSLASIYGFAFVQCNPDGSGNTQAFSRAAPAARVADVAAQVDEQIAAGGFRDRDISSLMVGVNDVLDLYGRYPATSEVDLLTQARERGKQTAQIVNRLVGLGVKVVVANVPDMGLSPYALNENASNGDIDRAALISRITAAFNEQLGVNIVLDGRYVALVQIDQRSQVIGRSPGSVGLANGTVAACTAPPPTCSTRTLVADATATGYLWSSDRWFGAGGQAQLASMAVERARRNPF